MEQIVSPSLLLQNPQIKIITKKLHRFFYHVSYKKIHFELKHTLIICVKRKTTERLNLSAHTQDANKNTRERKITPVKCKAVKSRNFFFFFFILKHFNLFLWGFSEFVAFVCDICHVQNFNKSLSFHSFVIQEEKKNLSTKQPRIHFNRIVFISCTHFIRKEKESQRKEKRIMFECERVCVSLLLFQRNSLVTVFNQTV